MKPSSVVCGAIVFASAAVAARPAAAAADSPVPPDLAVYGAQGLQLAGATLFKGQVDAAAYDPAQDLIWFTTGHTLEVVDLRDPRRAVTVIATKLPTDSFLVRGFSSAQHDTDYVGVYVAFDFGPKPSVAGEPGAYEGVDGVSDDKLKRAARKVKLVGKKWLAAQQGRKPNAALAERADPPKVTLPADVGQCDEDPDQCGRAAWLGDSAFQLVTVEHSCGDACHESCVLYDPAHKTFAEPLAPGGWAAAAAAAAAAKDNGGACWGYTVEPGKPRYAAGARVCTLGASMTCTDLTGWTAIAWVPESKP